MLPRGAAVGRRALSEPDALAYLLSLLSAPWHLLT